MGDAMGGGSVWLEILIFAMVAAFFVYRLRNVLGRKHGEEQERPNPFAQRDNNGATGPTTTRTPDTDNVIQLPSRGPATDMPDLPDASGGPVSLEDGLRLIRAADANFNERTFLQGAKAAFEMIVKAFAEGDTPTLRPLLADDVYDRFAAAIRERQAAGETLESRIHGFESVDLSAARMDGRTAHCTVTFTTRQTHVTRDAQGNVVDGDEGKPEEVTDIWTFSRNTRASDPNWHLSETRSGG
ncbi:Tim44/TimA family putative adaptor protein [Niveispirillum sp. KHB5.9]|uniref:Tim44/TimA family putative adaptor protein n=1 Tax=Niveispirillum sp. KHB5.9 TaxID=3400269 RepID=UPI003A86A98C